MGHRTKTIALDSVNHINYKASVNLMTGQAEIKAKLHTLQGLVPSGYALALHVRYTTPTFLFQTYDREWLDYYSQHGFVMTDPAVHWGFVNRGTRTWAELADSDSAGVFKAAADHGLNYGIACAMGEQASPSICAFARSDREFTQAETDEIMGHLVEIHELTDNLKALSPETAKALKEMSIFYTHPTND
jgi:LuxR family transcriptional regulator